MINEVHEITNVDDFIQKFQNYLNDDYYNKNFDCIIEKIEKRFPLFFNEKTNGLLYIIQKYYKQNNHGQNFEIHIFLPFRAVGLGNGIQSAAN